MAGLAAALLDDGEFVAAEPRHQLVAARHRAQPLRDLDQQLVAGGMAVNVVDRLEAVEVDAQHRERLVHARPPCSTLAGEMIGEDRAVGQAGQRIVIGEMGDPRGGFLALADVAHRQHAARRAAPVHRPLQHLDVALAPAGADQPAFGGALFAGRAGHVQAVERSPPASAGRSLRPS